MLPEASAIVSEALSVTGRGCELFELMCANDLEGIVAKRLADRYDTRARWLKIKNGKAMSQPRQFAATIAVGVRD